MSGRGGGGRAVRAAYRGCGPRVRAHVAARWASAPIGPVVDELPSRGRVLDLGCGHGVVSVALAQRAPEVVVDAVDVAVDKVAAARRAVRRAGLAGRVDVERVGTAWRPEVGAYDGVAVVDVLYLLGADAARDTLRAAARAVRPGGRVVVKAMGAQPRWKVRWDRAQETVAVRVVGLTAGSHVEPVPLVTIQSVLQEEGLETAIVALDRLRPHPHAAVVGTRPSSGDR